MRFYAPYLYNKILKIREKEAICGYTAIQSESKWDFSQHPI